MGGCSNLHQNPLCDFDFIRVLQMTRCHMFIQVVVQGSSKSTSCIHQFFQILSLCVFDTPYSIYHICRQASAKSCNYAVYTLVTRSHVLLRIRVFIKPCTDICRKYFLIWQDRSFILFIIMFHKSWVTYKTQNKNCFHHPFTITRM